MSVCKHVYFKCIAVQVMPLLGLSTNKICDGAYKNLELQKCIITTCIHHIVSCRALLIFYTYSLFIDLPSFSVIIQCLQNV